MAGFMYGGGIYNIAPKITLVVIMTFFPITVGMLDGFKEADPDAVRLLQAMGVSPAVIQDEITVSGNKLRAEEFKVSPEFMEYKKRILEYI